MTLNLLTCQNTVTKHWNAIIAQSGNKFAVASTLALTNKLGQVSNQIKKRPGTNYHFKVNSTNHQKKQA